MVKNVSQIEKNGSLKLSKKPIGGPGIGSHFLASHSRSLVLKNK